MPEMLNNKRTDASRTQFHDRRHATQMVAEEEEVALVAKGAFALALLGATPLIVLLIVHYFQLWFWCRA